MFMYLQYINMTMQLDSGMHMFCKLKKILTSLTFFEIFLARSAQMRVLRVSSRWLWAGETCATITVRQLPDKASCTKGRNEHFYYCDTKHMQRSSDIFHWWAIMKHDTAYDEVILTFILTILSTLEEYNFFHTS